MSANELHAWIEKHIARVDTNTDHIAELIVALAATRTDLARTTALLSELATTLQTHIHTQAVAAHSG